MSATITAAVLLFTVTLVAVQLASSNFSPRTLPGFLRDRSQQIAIGTVTATFAYSLLVLREVRVLSEDAPENVPNIAVATAVVLAIASLLAIIHAIDHTARSLKVERVANEAMRATIKTVRRVLDDTPGSPGAAPMTSPARPAVGAEAGGVRAVPIEPPADALVVDAPGPGWVQQISSQALRDALGEGQTVRLDVAVGSFVAEGTPLGHLWPPPDDEAETVRRIRRAFALGNERTLQQDVGLGLVRLGDIALRALSPSLNDPNTADEVIVRLGAVVREILLRELPSPVEEWEGRTIVRIHDVDHGDYVRRAFDQIRLGAASHPYVLATLVRTLGMLAKECERHGVPDRRQYLVAQVEAVQATLDRSLPEGDRRLVHQAVEESRLVDPARIADSS